MSLLEHLWDNLKPVRDKVAGAPVKRKTFTMMPKERLHLDRDPFPDQVDGAKFEAGASYFGLRLAGINLAQARRFATKTLPLCVCMAEYGRQGAERSIPFSIGPNIIRQKLKQAGVEDAAGAEQAWIELRDLTVVRPTPVDKNNLSLFVGLYAVPAGDVVETLLNVMGSLGGSLGATALGPAVDTAKAVYSGFGTLLGLKDIQPQVEAMNGRTLANLGSGYLLVANAPENVVQDRDLSIREGTLRDHAGELVSDFDYCLVAIEHYLSIVEMATQTAPDLFAEPASAVQAAVSDQDRAAYTQSLKKLLGRIQSSDDVVEADKDRLISGYASLFDKRWNQLANPAAATRAAGAGSLAAGLSLQIADPLRQGQNPKLAKALSTISEYIAKAPNGAGMPKGNETAAQLWDAVRRESASIAKAVKSKPHPGEVGTAFVHAVQNFQPAVSQGNRKARISNFRASK